MKIDPDLYDVAAEAYFATAEADPELTGFHEMSAQQIRSIGWALRGAGWLTPAEASELRRELASALRLV